MLTKITVVLDGEFESPSARYFEGYTSGERWNGFECPWLPIDEARHFLQYMQPPAELVEYKVNGLLVSEQGETPELMPFIVQETDDGPKTLVYMGGAYVWRRVPKHMGGA